ncbi:UPF0481 protein [Prunus yedoensis var. nudiflora]|uniref:UPF0481 protein n=1 Tax=Prunus yedoensis var. nudiflora TaxID=2094558 RepID=A0A314ZEG5_PRUYE|nr:UPF0481 protein [Prunus yedoensis var. nudiflora]
MMVVDGCFIVELFRKYAREVPIDDDDPVFNTSWMQSALRKDLFLLENQLSWKVIDCLFQHTKEKVTRIRSSTSVCFKFFEVSAFCRIHTLTDHWKLSIYLMA